LYADSSQNRRDLGEREVFVPKKQATNDHKFSHGPLEDGPQDFKFAVYRRHKAIAFTKGARSARLLVSALSMAEAMEDIANQEFIDWWIAWLGELAANSPKGGERKTKK
jgi:hypothetical protein